jgi:phosphocarrier protein
MIQKEYIILSADGMHARPAAALVKLVRKYNAVIQVQRPDKAIQLNSLLNILGLGVKGGDRIILTIEGEDEQEASAALDEFFMEQLKTL